MHEAANRQKTKKPDDRTAFSFRVEGYGEAHFSPRVRRREARDERRRCHAHLVRERRDAVGVRPPAAGTPADRSERASREAAPPRSLSVASANIFSRRRGADASIPHLQSDHLPVFLYQTVVPVAGAEIKLVLPESEDLVAMKEEMKDENCLQVMHEGELVWACDPSAMEDLMGWKANDKVAKWEKGSSIEVVVPTAAEAEADDSLFDKVVDALPKVNMRLGALKKSFAQWLQKE